MSVGFWLQITSSHRPIYQTHCQCGRLTYEDALQLSCGTQFVLAGAGNAVFECTMQHYFYLDIDEGILAEAWQIWKDPLDRLQSVTNLLEESTCLVCKCKIALICIIITLTNIRIILYLLLYIIMINMYFSTDIVVIYKCIFLIYVLDQKHQLLNNPKIKQLFC